MKRFLLLFLLLAQLAFADWASTVNDTTKTGTCDGSRGDYATALAYVDGKNQDGWTIYFPAGTFTWTSNANMASTQVHSVTVSGAVIGSPTRGTNNTTIIRFNFTTGSQGMGFQATNGKTTKVQFITFQMVGSNTLDSGFCAIDSTSATTDAVNSFWFENCYFDNPHPFALVIVGPNIASAPGVFGLIDLCTFRTGTGDPGANAYNGIYVYSGNYGNSFTANVPAGMWTKSSTLGTVNTVCVEDCTFTNVIATEPGHPTIDCSYGGSYLQRYCTMTNWVAVAHGSDTAATSTYQVEFYQNTTTVDTLIDFGIYIRGGNGVIYSNAWNVTGSGGYNSGVKLTNDSSGSSYPYFEQVGRGSTAGTENTLGLYVYTNSFNGIAIADITTNGAHASDIQLNRDYFTAAPSGSTPLTSYTPLQYPHPLRGGGGSTATSALSGTVKILGNAVMK
jgi:hypothetical protein